MKDREPSGVQEPVFCLETKLRELIAERFGVSPNEVTLDFIRQRRAELYAQPNYKFIHAGEEMGLKTRSLSETELEAKMSDAFLEQFAKNYNTK